VNADTYQALAMRTAAPQSTLTIEPALAGMLNAAMGMAGEAGELVDLLKKAIFHGHPLTAEVFEKMDKEVGDVGWYRAQYATYRGLRLSAIDEQNIAKLAARYGEKFSTEASLNRAEYKAEFAHGVTVTN
jgi:NTP pyrophosphatase (non-canonical NTP hydrolase)